MNCKEEYIMPFIDSEIDDHEIIVHFEKCDNCKTEVIKYSDIKSVIKLFMDYKFKDNCIYQNDVITYSLNKAQMPDNLRKHLDECTTCNILFEEIYYFENEIIWPCISAPLPDTIKLKVKAVYNNSNKNKLKNVFDNLSNKYNTSINSLFNINAPHGSPAAPEDITDTDAERRQEKSDDDNKE